MHHPKKTHALMSLGISKAILDKVNMKLTSSIQVNQWRNSSAVIKCFKNIQNRNNCSFTVFDIENFYPSILLILFNSDIQFAKEICDISDNNISIMIHTRNTLLFNNREPWVKRMVTKILMYQWAAMMRQRYLS